MTITATSFRIDFPEFTSVPDWPTSIINYYLALSTLLLSTTRFGTPGTAVTNPPDNMYDMATELFVAHHISIEKQAMNAVAGGGVPGVTTGPVASKSVGPVSISYSPGDVINKDAGFWNQTMYGLRFYKLLMMFGAGPVQVGIGQTPFGAGYGAAWPGPFSWPGWQD